MSANGKKPTAPPKPLDEVAAELQKKIVAALQEKDPKKLAAWERLEAERQEAIALEIEKMKKAGQTPGLKGKKLPR